MERQRAASNLTPINCKLLEVVVDIRDIMQFVVERKNGERILVAVDRNEFLDKWTDSSIEHSIEARE